MIQNLKHDEHAAELLKSAQAESALGRVLGPIPIEEADLRSCAVATRFSVDQGGQICVFINHNTILLAPHAAQASGKMDPKRSAPWIT